MGWEPERYLQFADERLRPAQDLLARVPLPAPARVVDLGCGPGNVTALLAQRWPRAELIGIDASTAMLDRARRALPEARFEQADIRHWTPAEAPDLIFSNAALHWLDDHPSLFPRLLSLLAPGGVLLVNEIASFSLFTHLTFGLLEGWWLHTDTALRIAGCPALSPMRLGPVEHKQPGLPPAKSLENWWQAGKVYPSEADAATGEPDYEMLWRRE